MNKIQNYYNISDEYKLNNNLTFRTFTSGLEDFNFIENIWNQSNEGIYFGKLKVKSYTNFYSQNDFKNILDESTRYLVNHSIDIKEFCNTNHAFAKRVWLLDEYINGGRQFKTPLCVHWNPRINDNMIHPGASRIKIIELLEDNEYDTDVWYFNTLGIQFDFMKHMKKLNKKNFSNLYKKEDGFLISFSADFGTIVPHISIKGGLTTYWGSLYHEKCRSIVKERCIYVNKSIKELNVFKKVSKEKADISLFIKNKITPKVKSKILLFSFLNHNYEDDDILIQTKTNII